MSVGKAGPVVLVGAGNMGGAMLAGWLKSGVPGGSILVIDPGPSAAMQKLIADNGARHEVSPPAGTTAGVLFVAVKPQVMEGALPSYASFVAADTLVLSIAAGRRVALFERMFGSGTAIVRAMPNTPAAVGRGVTVLCANSAVTSGQRELAGRLMGAVGEVHWTADEELMHAVTAVSGSGPAYVFYLVECMAEAGRKLGLPADLAMRLARETVSGAGELLHQSPEDAAKLRQNVTSPGGTTAAALSVLMADDGIQPIFDRAVAAARKRAEELAG